MTQIETVANNIVARDVTAGRPGKQVVTTPIALPNWPFIVSLIALVCAIVALGMGLLAGGGTATTATLVTPDNAIAAVTEQPETSTVPASPTLSNAPVFGQIQFTCNGNPVFYPLAGTVTLGSGGFSLSTLSTMPFNGTLGPTFAVNATGTSGTITGTLVTGRNQILSLTTQDTHFPCVRGPFPLGLVLPSALDLTPMAVVGANLAGLIQGRVLIASTPICPECGAPHINWALVFALLGTAVVSDVAFWLWWRWALREKERDEMLYYVHG